MVKNLFCKIKAKQYILKYDIPTNGVIYKKGCFKNTNKVVAIKHNGEEIGKAKIKGDKTGVYIAGYIINSETKDGVRIIKDFELTEIGIFDPAFYEK